MTGEPDAAPGKGRGHRRHAARLAAVQALFQVEHNDADAELVILEFVQHRHGAVLGEAGDKPAKLDQAHFADLVRGTTRRRTDIDRWLSAALVRDWPLPRLDSVLRAILRCATYELWARPDVPAKVIISEYVDLADAFFSGEEPKLVNAVLDRIGRQLRQADLGPDPHGRDAAPG